MVETLTPPKAPKYQQDKRILEARVKLAAHLGLPPDDVTIQIGNQQESDGRIYAQRIGSPTTEDIASQTETVSIIIHKPGFDLEQDRVREEIRATLAQLKPLADVAQMVPEVKLAVKLKKDLQDATKGTNFKQELLNWPGFDEKMHKNHVQIPDHAVENVTSGAYGVGLSLRFPSENEAEQKQSLEKFAEITRGRTEAIKGIMLERVLKYNAENISARGLNEQEAQTAIAAGQAAGKSPDESKAAALVEKIRASEAKIRTDFAKLKITVNSIGDWGGANTPATKIQLTIQSPEQAAAEEKAKATQTQWENPSNGDELRNTNPLTSLVVGLSTSPTPATDTTPEKSPQLHRALARAILFDKDKNPIPDFVKIAGSKDIQIAIAKEMMRILPPPEQKAEREKKEAQFSEMLNSPLFKEHRIWHGGQSDLGKADVAKPYPQFQKVADENDTLRMTLTVRKDADPAKNQLKQLIEGLAGHAQTPPAVQAPAAAPAPVAPAAQAPVAAPAQAAAPVTPEQKEEARQTNADVYKNIARDIINLHKAKNPGQTWVNRAQDESKDQGRPGPG